jgi:hypothetical protein
MDVWEATSEMTSDSPENVTTLLGIALHEALTLSPETETMRVDLETERTGTKLSRGTRTSLTQSPLRLLKLLPPPTSVNELIARRAGETAMRSLILLMIVIITTITTTIAPMIDDGDETAINESSVSLNG